MTRATVALPIATTTNITASGIATITKATMTMTLATATTTALATATTTIANPRSSPRNYFHAITDCLL